MTIKQKRAIYYAIRKKEVARFEKFIVDNNINLKDLGLDKVKYMGVIKRKLRKMGYNKEEM